MNNTQQLINLKLKSAPVRAVLVKYVNNTVVAYAVERGAVRVNFAVTVGR